MAEAEFRTFTNRIGDRYEVGQLDVTLSKIRREGTQGHADAVKVTIIIEPDAAEFYRLGINQAPSDAVLAQNNGRIVAMLKEVIHLLQKSPDRIRCR